VAGDVFDGTMGAGQIQRFPKVPLTVLNPAN
jgi:hypothetical protein